MQSEPPSHVSNSKERQSWVAKFRVAFAGLTWAIKSQNSFYVHVPLAIAVLIVAAIINVETWRWCVLILTIAIVFAAELFNTSLEVLVSVIHPKHDKAIGQCLDVAAAAVLVLSIAAIAIGLLARWGNRYGRPWSQTRSSGRSPSGHSHRWLGQSLS